MTPDVLDPCTWTICPCGTPYDVAWFDTPLNGDVAVLRCHTCRTSLFRDGNDPTSPATRWTP